MAAGPFTIPRPAITDNANLWQFLMIGSYMSWPRKASCAVNTEETDMIGPGQRGLKRTGNRENLTQLPYLFIGLRRGSWGLVDQ